MSDVPYSTDEYGATTYHDIEPTTQENTVTEQTPTPTQEPIAVSKLREAFDTARNAIIEGSELAKLVAELRISVQGLTSEVGSLKRDLDYMRSRNRELDEQVTQVRQARDQAIKEASANLDRAVQAETERDGKQAEINRLSDALEKSKEDHLYVSRARDDAELRALDAEEKLKEALAKLDKFHAAFADVFPVNVKAPEAPTPPQPEQHEEPKPLFSSPIVEEQPRDPVTQQFRPYRD